MKSILDLEIRAFMLMRDALASRRVFDDNIAMVEDWIDGEVIVALPHAEPRAIKLREWEQKRAAAMDAVREYFQAAGNISMAGGKS